MSKRSILDKLDTVISELQYAGDKREVDWLICLKSQLNSFVGQDLSQELKKKLVELSQKSVAPRGYVDTQGNLDMATWGNLLDDLAKDLKRSFKVQ